MFTIRTTYGERLATRDSLMAARRYAIHNAPTHGVLEVHDATGAVVFSARFKPEEGQGT